MSQNKYIGQRTKDVFTGKVEGRGISLLVVEALGKEGYAHSAVRLPRRGGSGILSPFCPGVLNCILR